MKGKITHITPRGEYTIASGSFNKYQIRFDDGKEFQFLAKGEFKKSVGDLVDYKVTNEEYKTAKLEYNPLPTVNNTSKDHYIIRQSMVKAAVDFHKRNPQADIYTVMRDAEILINFIINK